MKRATTIVIAAVGITIGLAYAADARKDPGFNALDKNSDGYLTRTEASADSSIARNFKQVDKNGDGRISRAEYLQVKAKQDLKPASAGATK